jgi:tRNA pseudouridine38-40 synthase
VSNRSILLTLAYDGTDYVGWQVQPKGRSVQGVLEEALGEVHKEPTKTVAAGRTDSGVHARGQRVSFSADSATVPPEKYREALNSLLPPDIRVLRSKQVRPGFSARHDARLRSYRYYLLPAPVVPPEHTRYCLRVRGDLNVSKLNRLAAHLIGERDFTTFAAANDEVDHAVRRVFDAGFVPEGPFLTFRISANGFLWKMVRSVVGTLLECQDEGLDAFAERVASCDRNAAGTTAPPRGLFFQEVRYDAVEAVD